MMIETCQYTKALTSLLNKSNVALEKGFPDRSVGKELPAMQETPAQFLGGEDPLEKG